MKVSHLDETSISGYTVTASDKKNTEFLDENHNTKLNFRSFEVPLSNKLLLENCKLELRKEDTISAVCNVTLFGLSVMQHNLYFENLYVATEFVENLRIFIVALAASSIIWIIRRYQIVLNMMLANYKVTSNDNLYSSGLYKPLVLELFIAMLVMPPYSDFTFTVQMLGFSVEYSFSAIVTFMSFLRLFFTVRLFGHFSNYTNLKASKICRKQGAEADELFALRSFMFNSSIVGISFNFICMCLFFTLSMQLSDEPDNLIHGVAKESLLRSFWDNLWVLCYTTTTVGYGNIYPKTHLGRACCIISCILGNMYLGMLILVIHQNMGLDYNQNLSYAWISRRSFRQKKIKYARTAIRSSVTLYLLSKKWKAKVLSPIKPNGVIEYNGVTFHNDLLTLTTEQYRKKLMLFRKLRNALDGLKDVTNESRNVGKTDLDMIYDFEDVVRIDFPAVLKKIRRVVKHDDVGLTESFTRRCLPFENNCKKVRDFSKYLRRRFAQTVSKKNTMVSNLTYVDIPKPAEADIMETELS